MLKKIIFFSLLSFSVSLSFSFSENSNLETKVYGYRIKNSYPHDRSFFTQGLLYDTSFLYESTGLYDHSKIIKRTLESPNPILVKNLDKKFFGEGITLFENKIIQLTWKSKIAFVYDKENLNLLDKFTFKSQGWGITSNGTHLIISDGSSVLYFLNPVSYKEEYRLNVTYQGKEIINLNELEFIEGNIYSNVWGTNHIAIISQKTGNVTAWIDLTGLLNEPITELKGNILNGIAYDKKDKRLFVTGKLWPKIFEIEIVPPKSN